jgi:hypothetical protein
MEKKYCIFHIEGGLGKHILSTAVSNCIKNNYPDRELIVVCAYPEVFLNLPFVDRVYRLGSTPYFYEDFIKDKDSLIFRHEPYFTTNHIHKNTNLIENWCDMYNLKYNGEKPSLIFNLRQKQYGFNKWNRNKPVLILQTNGGPLTEQPYPYSWVRDIPIDVSQRLVDHLSDYYHIIQVCRDEKNALNNVEVVFEPMSNMEFLSMLLVSEKRLLIDSSLQHAAAALGLSSTVLWIGTDPSVFGYKIHNNIRAKIPNNVKLPDSYLFDYNFNGLLHECPLMDTNIFNINEILESIVHG